MIRKQSGTVAIIILATIAAIFLFMRSKTDVTAPPEYIYRPQSIEKSSHRTNSSARKLGMNLVDDSRQLRMRLKSIRNEIDRSERPDATFETLASMIESVEDPLERLSLVGDIFNGMAGFDTAEETVAWLQTNNEHLKKYFSGLASGTTGMDCYSQLFSVIAGRAFMKGRSQELINILSNDRSTAPQEVTVALGSSVAVSSSNYGLLDSLNEPVQQQCLSYIMRVRIGPLDPGFAMREYVGPNFQKLNDPDGSLLEGLVSSRWVANNYDEVLRIIRNSDPSPNRENLIRVASLKMEGVDIVKSRQLIGYLTNSSR